VDYTAFGGISGSVTEAEAYLRFVATFLRTQHLMSNTIVEPLEDGRLRARTMFYNPLDIVGLEVIYSPFGLCGGWYINEYRYGEDGALLCDSLSQEASYTNLPQSVVKVLLALGAVVYFLLLRPRRRRAGDNGQTKDD
jgi:hypothetical protein